jgi:hypothetical protein
MNEDQHTERGGEGHPYHDEQDGDRHAVKQRHQHLAAHVAAEAAPARRAGPVDALLGGPREQADHPAPDQLAIAEQV